MADLEYRQRVVALMQGVEFRDLIDLVMVRPSWMKDGLCREYPEISFIPEQGQHVNKPLAICARCACRAECLAFGVEHDEEGVWGGTTAMQRRAMRRNLAS